MDLVDCKSCSKNINEIITLLVKINSWYLLNKCNSLIAPDEIIVLINEISLRLKHYISIHPFLHLGHQIMLIAQRAVSVKPNGLAYINSLLIDQFIKEYSFRNKKNFCRIELSNCNVNEWAQGSPIVPLSVQIWFEKLKDEIIKNLHMQKQVNINIITFFIKNSGETITYNDAVKYTSIKICDFYN